MLKKNDIIRLNINDLTNLGFGVGRHEGAVVFVSDTVPGDTADAKVILAKGSYYVARVERFIKKSEMRCEGRCDNSACKSCAYKNISYEDELRLKENIIRDAFVHEGLSEVAIRGVIPSPMVKNYRNKAQYPISIGRDGEYVVGFYAPKSHRVTEARYCPLSPTIFGEIIDVLVDYFKKNSISVYNEETGEGLLRHIYLRRGEVSSEILLTLVINGKSLPDESGLVKLIKESFPDVVGILINTNTKRTNVILGDSYRVVFGRDHIYDTLRGVRLKITAPSFYQVNRSAAELLYSKATELLSPKGDELVLDLFCGAGSIGLSMAENIGELIGIEIVESAVECARDNAASNGISRAKFYTGDASDTEKLLSVAERELGKEIVPDAIILDPPRAGCDERLVRFASSLNPKKIVYISCNPATLARDCKRFKEFGYVTEEVFGVDLFPMTGHVESVVSLTRRLDVDMRR